MNYIEQAIRTKSDKFYGEKVGFDHFINVCRTAIMAAIELDKIKKALFYGKGEDSKDVPTLESLKKGNAVNIDILHGILGCVTEAGEMLEMLDAALTEDGQFKDADYVNLKEEVFDHQWYHAIMCNALGITFEEGQENNIAKLRARFPEKFTEHHAINRDLEKERQILESGSSQDS